MSVKIRNHGACQPGFFVFDGHGIWNPGVPDQSGIYLAAPLNQDGSIPQENGPYGKRTQGDLVYLAELRKFGLDNCRLSIMGACETGLIDVQGNADEFNGLPAALLEAGSAAVVSTLWPVSALVTPKVVDSILYNVVQKKMTPAQSLRTTQISIRNNPEKFISENFNQRSDLFNS